MSESCFTDKLEVIETSFRELLEIKIKLERVDLLGDEAGDYFYCLRQSISGILSELVLDKEVSDER